MMNPGPSPTPSKKIGKLPRERIIKLIVTRIQDIEFSWQDQDARRRKLVELKNWLRELHHNKDVDLPYLTRLHEHIRAEITLEQFYSLVVPIERDFDLLSITDKDFVITSEDLEEREADIMPVKIILDSLRSAFNVGGIFRTGECAGVEQVIACGYTATPEQEKVAKAAMGTEKHLSWATARDIKTAAQEMKKQHIPVIALETVEGAPAPQDFQFPFPCALLLGNERFGLNKQMLEHADHVVSIPTYGKKNSMNVVSAFAVCIYEMRRQWEAFRKHDKPREETRGQEGPDPVPAEPPKRLYRDVKPASQAETLNDIPDQDDDPQALLF